MQCLKFFALKILLFSAILITKAQETEVQIIPEKLSDNLFMLTGQGGNISIFSREDHIFMIDDQFKPLSKPLKETFAILSPNPISIVCNPPLHGDHTRGNANFNSKEITITLKTMLERAYVKLIQRN
ncbi:hypothetical protein [Cellulophaga sp. Z1A5H]|uniref:hypothetical protein n=1 Tax=Cellulophaga sp. Z1A5H TaxID=2687291 RepID=UPI0013FDBDD9|nr:hypothetical protein [Cellulophaga sp. Z1A5H]